MNLSRLDYLVRKLLERKKTRPDKKVDAFRDESVSTIFDLKINDQLEHNELYDVHKNAYP
jgi:hypothetical protein